MLTCTSCGQSVLEPKLTSSPVIIVKGAITENELAKSIPFTNFGLRKFGEEERTTSFYLAKEMGMVGLQFSSFSLTNLFMHIPSKSKKTKEAKLISDGCLSFSIEQLKLASQGKKIMFVMGAELIKLLVGKTSSDVYGLVCKSDLLPDVPVIIPAPNSDKMMNQPIGEFRNSIHVLEESVRILENYEKIGEK